MYAPKYAQNTDPLAARQFIKDNGFAILISLTGGQLWATHIPMILSEDSSKLSGHVSKANKQWKGFETNTADVLAIFNGPHTYISSSWYDHENVPTWNYIAVHVYGSIRIIEGDELYESIRQLTHKYEQHSEKPVSVETMTPDYVRRELNGLVGFEIEIKNIEATYKLSQNRDAENHKRIVTELEKRADSASIEVAELMKITKKND